MSYSPKIREDLIGMLYKYKKVLKNKKPMTQLVNEAVEEYLSRKNKETKVNASDEKLNEKGK